MDESLSWRDYVVVPIEEGLLSIATYLPSLVGALAVLIVGWVLALVVRFLLRRALSAMRFDAFAERIGAGGAVASLGFTAPLHRTVAHAAYWLMLFVVFVVAINALGIPATTNLLTRLLDFVPGLIGGTFILFIGLFLAARARAALNNALARSPLPGAPFVAEIGYWAIVAYVTTAALDELGVNTALLQSLFTIILAAVAFSAALAFGLGGRKHASSYLSEMLRRRASGEPEPEPEGASETASG